MRSYAPDLAIYCYESRPCLVSGCLLDMNSSKNRRRFFRCGRKRDGTQPKCANRAWAAQSVKPEFRLTTVIYPDPTRVVAPRVAALAPGSTALTDELNAATRIGVAISPAAVVGIAANGPLGPGRSSSRTLRVLAAKARRVSSNQVAPPLDLVIDQLAGSL